MMKKIIGLVYGGKSAEHDVSLVTAFSVMRAIDFSIYRVVPVYITLEGEWVVGEVRDDAFEKQEQLLLPTTGQQDSIASLFQQDQLPFDVVFPVLHGTNGEDGTVQGLFEVLNIPYVGNGVLASSAAMDKVVMKQLFEIAGLNQVAYVHFIRSSWENNRKGWLETIQQELTYPLFVKPANLGSSVGISKVDEVGQLEQAIDYAFKFDRKIVIENGVTAREVEVAVLGNDSPICSVAGEIKPLADFYDYEAKYSDQSTELVIPAVLDEKVYDELVRMAKEAYRVLDCAGLVRADFFVTASQEIYINEVNTLPGFTPVSMYPLLWKETGKPYSELITDLIDLAYERYEEKQSIQYTRD